MLHDNAQQMAQAVEATYPRFQTIPPGTDCEKGSNSEAVELGCLWKQASECRDLWSLDNLPKEQVISSYLRVT